MGTSTVFDYFSKLLKDSARERVGAGVSLIKYLSEQSQKSVDNKELNHVLTRLIRGLGSSRISSRKGFYSTLTVHLKMHPKTEIDTIFGIMEQELKPSKSNDKSENASIHTGRILACGALIRSNILKHSSSEDQVKVLECLVHSGKQRSYLGFLFVIFLKQFLDQFNENEDISQIWPVLEREFCKPLKEHNLDTFYGLLLIEEKFPSVLTKKMKKKCFGSSHIITPETIPEILRILNDIPRLISRKHPVFELFGKKLVTTEFTEIFWSAVDCRFCKPTKTDEFVGTEMFRLILENLEDKTLILFLLSKNFINYMVNRFFIHAKQKDDEIANNFKKSLSKIIDLVEKEPKSKFQLNVLKRLIMYPGDLLIEKKTGIKIIQKLTNYLNIENVKKLCKLYQQISSNSKFKDKQDSTTEPWTNVERTYAGQLLSVRLLNHPEVILEHEWRVEKLKFLFHLGMCEHSNVGGELAPNFKDSFYRALDHKLRKLDDLREVLTNLINSINDDLFVKSNLKLRTPLKQEAIDSWKLMLKLSEKLNNHNSINKNISVVFQTMNFHMGLQLFNDPDIAISAITELHSCITRLMTNSKNLRKNNSESLEPEWIEVIVDLLLSLLSRSSHLFRSLVNCVFPHMCPHLTPSSIHQILDVLNVKSGKNPLTSNTEADDSDMSDSDEESDAENTAKNEDVKVEDSDEDHTEDESDLNSGESGAEDETITDRLRLAVSQALGDSKMQTDDEDIDVDQIDEEEGKRLDKSLAAAFKILKQSRRNNNSKKQDKSAQALTHFRIRTIDLLEIYLDSNPSMSLTLDILVPLVDLLEFTIKDPHQKPLMDRVRSCLKKLSSIKKFSDTNNVDEEVLKTLLKIVIEKGERSSSICQEMGDKLADSCVFLVRCFQIISPDSDTFVNIIGENLTAFFKKRDCVLPALLFKYLLQIQWEGNWKLAELLINLAFDTSIRSYRRTQALDFLKTFYHNARMISSEKRQKLKNRIEKDLCRMSIDVLLELTNLDSSENSKSSNDLKKEIKQKYVSALFTLLATVHAHHIPETWDWPNLGKAMTKYRENVSLANDTRSSFNKLARLIGIENPGQKQQNDAPSSKVMNGNADFANEEENKGNIIENGNQNGLKEESPEDNFSKSVDKKKKKHKKKEVKKLKKESRSLREKAMSEGLEMVNFSNFNHINGVDHDDHSTDLDEKKHDTKTNTKNESRVAEKSIDGSEEALTHTTSKMQHKRHSSRSQDVPLKKKKKAKESLD